MRGLMRATLWTLTRKSSGSRETEITAFAVMPSTFSSFPLVTTVTPVGKWLIAPRKASASAPITSQQYPFSLAPSAGILTPSAGPDLLETATLTQLSRPPAHDRLSVRPVPETHAPVVIDPVDEDVLRAGKQGSLEGHDAVPPHPSRPRGKRGGFLEPLCKGA